jgi:fibronectin-binding autotransporter adhesin
MAEGSGARSARRACALAVLLASMAAVFTFSCAVALAAQGSSRASAHASKLTKPKKLTRPTISGTIEDGQVLTAHNGEWQGAAPIDFSYQWEACRGGCSPIPEATGPTYRIDTAETGSHLEVLITAGNPQGVAVARSKHTTRVLAGPPVNTAPPAISGTPAVGQTLEASTGSWAGTPSFTYTYQWLSCNILGECLEIAGATTPTYTVPALDVASTLEVVVTARNHIGEANATSQATAAVPGIAPVDEELPTITGLLTDGQLLSVLVGEWEGTGPLTYTYQWLLCNAKGEECADISEAAAATLSLVSGDVGKTLRAAVTVTNAAGSATATSPATGIVGALVPSNVELPSIAGSLLDGQLLEALTGSWSGSTPLSYSFQWELCNAKGGECANVSEAFAATLSLVSADVGKTVRVAVTATNSGGSTTATSPATSAIAALLPSNTGLPGISGLLQVGQLLHASTGSWSGTMPIVYSYQWQSCLLGSCQNIAKAAESVLKLELADVGLAFRVVVTATNAAGSVSADSSVTGILEGLL